MPGCSLTGVVGHGPPARADEKQVIERGRELFVREWVPDDQRSHGGDGLGPVYNERSCVGCHHQGPTGAGGGSAGTNIELITPSTAGQTNSPGFYYAFSYNFGPNGFEYHFGDPSAVNGAAAARELGATERRRAGADPSPASATRPAWSFTDTATIPTIASGASGC